MPDGSSERETARIEGRAARALRGTTELEVTLKALVGAK
jgi:hypothetical protein